MGYKSSQSGDSENWTSKNKESKIKKAEGDKQSTILAAEAQAEAIKQVADANKYQEITVAEGKAKATEITYNAIHTGNPTNDLIAIKYLEALEKVADGNATKIFLPTEVSGILGSVGGIAELFKEDSDNVKVIEQAVEEKENKTETNENK